MELHIKRVSDHTTYVSEPQVVAVPHDYISLATAPGETHRTNLHLIGV